MTVIGKGKISHTPNETQSVENTNSNTQSFLKISPVQKEVHPLYNLKEPAYK